MFSISLNVITKEKVFSVSLNDITKKRCSPFHWMSSPRKRFSPFHWMTSPRKGVLHFTEWHHQEKVFSILLNDITEERCSPFHRICSKPKQSSAPPLVNLARFADTLFIPTAEHLHVSSIRDLSMNMGKVLCFYFLSNLQNFLSIRMNIHFF